MPKIGQSTNRHRSPSYPSLDLKESVDKVEVLNKEEKRHAVPVAVAAGHLGYGDIKSSSALRGISALKQFGLITEEEAGDDRKVRVSPLALEILLATSNEERAKLLKKAALLPPLYSKIWNHYDGKLPSDATIRAYLIRDVGFNDTYVSLFLKKFRSTIAYAKLGEGDMIRPVEDDVQQAEELGDDMEDTLELPARTAKDKPPRQAVRDDWDGPSLKLELPRGNTADIRLRSKLTKKEFQTFKQLFELAAKFGLVEDDPDETDDFVDE